MDQRHCNIGILGAGELASALAAAGHTVRLSARDAASAARRAAATGQTVVTIDAAARFGEIVVAALPLGALDAIPVDALVGKIVLDTMNYYPRRDGAIAAFDSHRIATSEHVARRLPGARVVKAFNAILAYDLAPGDRPDVPGGRRALPIASDDAGAAARVAALHAQLDFETVSAGSLADSWRFERAKPAYCVPLNAAQLRDALAAAARDVELPHGSWRRLPRADAF